MEKNLYQQDFSSRTLPYKYRIIKNPGAFKYEVPGFFHSSNHAGARRCEGIVNKKLVKTISR